MKSFFLLLPLALVISCSKVRLPNPPEKGFGNRVSWRFVEYDSTNRVVDSTQWIVIADSILQPTILGPNAVNVIPILRDTDFWPPAAACTMVLGPFDFGPQFGNLQVVKGGCAINVVYNNPTLDRSGWNLQRAENGHIINMFAQSEPSGYDGKYNDFPYPNYYDGIPYPSDFQSDYINSSWICGTTQGSCELSPVL